MRRSVLAALVVAAVPAAALAHSPYLLPNAFDLKDRDHVTVEASFTEVFLEPDIVMRSSAYAVVGPDGARTPLAPTYLSDLAVLEAATPAPGTYRITTGAREGRIAKAYFADGEWTFLEEPNARIPTGANAVDMQSLTLADVYVSRGAPTQTALKPVGKGLEFVALTHPNSIFVGEEASFLALYDGKPVPGLPIEIRRADGRYGDGKPPATATTAADGKFSLTPARAGLYHLMSRYRLPPEPGGKLARSFTYALTFEATP